MTFGSSRGARLHRFLATWSDGKELVLHARTRSDAEDLARKLEPPAGVWVRSVLGISS